MALKEKYQRSLIKLGNSIAITFPQEWTKGADLKEKSEITLYPIDEKSLLVRSSEKENEKVRRIYHMDGIKKPLRLIRQAILSAFKLNVDEIHLKYNNKIKEEIYELLIDLRREIIGIDFKDVPEYNEFHINFLISISRAPRFHEVIEDLVSVFSAIFQNILTGNLNKTSNLLLEEIDRKYSLGTRILITGLSEYPLSQYQLPIIRFLGDRVILLYIRDFINETLINFQDAEQSVIDIYSDLLKKIPKLLENLIDNYKNNDINIETLSDFQEKLIGLEEQLQSIESTVDHKTCNVRNVIKYYLRGFQVFLDIATTRMIERKVGLV